MKFSVIIAAYNVAPYIEQSIDSCIHQDKVSISDYDIIVIDDGSNDGTETIIEKYRDVKNIHIIHQRNIGLSATRNHGVKVAKGEFIVYLDGDDWLASNALYEFSKYIKTSDLVVFPLLYYYSSENIEKRSLGLENRLYTSKEFFHETVGQAKTFVIPAPCKVYRKSILLDTEQFFIEGILHEDIPYFVDTVSNYKRITYVDEGLYYYRQKREGSITTHRTIRNFEGYLIGLNHIIDKVGLSDKDMNFMLASQAVVRTILTYSDNTREIVNKYYRQFAQKKYLIRLFFNSTFKVKYHFRLFLLILDPVLLQLFIRLYSGNDIK